MRDRVFAALLTVACLAPAPAHAQHARDLYTRALAEERVVRDDANKPTLAHMRRVVALYESVVRRHPASGYSDNALWQAANVAALAYQRFGSEADRRTATRLFTLLAQEYPSSKLVPQASTAAADLRARTPGADRDRRSPAANPVTDRQSRSDSGSLAAPASVVGLATLKDIKRTVLPEGIRLTVDLDAEIAYHQEEIANPRRLFFDLKGVKAAPPLQDAALTFDDDVVKEIRLGRHPHNTTRLVVDLDGVGTYTVYPLYGPYRLVVDFRRGATAPPITATVPVAVPIATPPPLPAPRATTALATLPQIRQAVPERSPAVAPAPLPSRPAASRAMSPAVPASNSNGKFSLSRQLGLGVSRVVIDAGHGGHDPGAHGHGITESELTLDVALRVQTLLQKQPGIDVVMTRDTDVYIPLEERTAIANREGADLFLSIHANASRNVHARGIETYFLNFAMNPEAEAVAARENATSAQAMHSLPDIVRAIALNNKLNESRDLAGTVQRSMVKRMSARNRAVKDLGVKQAPFVVLIGAGMPSVLAEVSFLTNKQDGAMLKTAAYRQQIAQALCDAIVTYQQSLKRVNAIAGKKVTNQ